MVLTGARLLRWAMMVAMSWLSASIAFGNERVPPAGDGSLSLRPAEVALIRDTYGTPHLYATTEHDAFFGLGYAYAEDRLRQVLLSYLQIQGRLAEMFGPGSLANQRDLQLPSATVTDTVASDLNARRLRYLDDARANFNRLPRQLQRNLRAYISGLQRYMGDHPERVPSWAPALEPAMPLALLAKLMTLDFQEACDARLAASQATEHETRQSNAWAVAGTRTSNGAVIFSSDSHGPLQTEFGPAFYNWRMKAGTLDVLSFDLPGTASFFFAHTNRFAWGWTEGKRNVVDCYAVRVERDHARKFRFDGKIELIEAVPYRIEVKGAQPLTGDFEYTRHNGVRSPVVKRQDDVAYVMSSPYFGRWGLAAGEYYRMAQARDRHELTSALAEREIYPANLVVGGRDGTLLYIRPGRIPVRKPRVDPERILDGNHSATAWRGVHEYADLLKLINPPQGYVSNSNVSPDRMYRQSPFRPQDYPSYFGFEPGLTTKRQARLLELLESTEALTIERAQAMVMDSKLPGAEFWRTAIASAANGECDQARDYGTELRRVIDALKDFDGVFRKESKAALYFAMMRSELTMNHAAVVDGIVTAVEQSQPLSPPQQCVLLATVQSITNALIERHGTVDVTLGDVHTVEAGSVKLPVGGVSFFAGRDLPEHMTRGTAPARFSVADTVRKMVFSSPQFVTAEPATLQSGQRIPYLVVFTDPVRSYAQLLPGISEDPASAHHSDQAVLASEGRLRSTYLDLKELLSNAESVRTLRVVSLSDRVKQELRARDYGLAPGVLPTGPANAITDVRGVRVGHRTVIEGDNVRTGVTVVLPHSGNLFQNKVPAAVAIGNGYGKLTGVSQIQELGELETPIAVTNTLSVPAVAAGLVDWTLRQPGNEQVVSVNPVVGETNDATVNDIRARAVVPEHVWQALRDAADGPVAEGSIGAGTGTHAFGWKGGVGTSSRVVPQVHGGYTVGVLVVTNYGGVLTMMGAPVGQELQRYYLRDALERDRADGSVIVVVATDAPLSDRNLERLARRALLGIARTGSPMTNGSGDYALAFATHRGVLRTIERRRGARQVLDLANEDTSPLFQAAVEATEEAVYNAIVAARTVDSRIGTLEKLPIERLREVLSKYGVKQRGDSP